MMKTILTFGLLALFLSACSSKTGPGANYTKFGVVEHRVLSVREGGGGPLGGFIGSLTGSIMGTNRYTSTLGVVVGGVAGSYAGQELSRYDSSKLTIGFDDGDSIEVDTRDLSILVGDRVKVVKEANQFPIVEKIVQETPLR